MPVLTLSEAIRAYRAAQLEFSKLADDDALSASGDKLMAAAECVVMDAPVASIQDVIQKARIAAEIHGDSDAEPWILAIISDLSALTQGQSIC